MSTIGLSTRHEIAVSTAEGEIALVGVLEQLEPEKPTKGRKIAIILHGAMGHKDYLFQKRLAKRLPLDSFRFDFRGNHESSGKWRFSGMLDDYEDILAVVDYLKGNFEYEVDLIVGHSRGSISGLYWMSLTEDGKRCRGFVNASGRYRMNRIYDGAKNWEEEFNTLGYHVMKAVVARKEFVYHATRDDLKDFAEFDTSIFNRSFPQNTHVLSIHGLQDKIVPPYDSVIYGNVFGARSAGTHNLHIIEDADHNFTNRQDEIVSVILQWWDKLNHGELKTGLWPSIIMGKL